MLLSDSVPGSLPQRRLWTQTGQGARHLALDLFRSCHQDGVKRLDEAGSRSEIGDNRARTAAVQLFHYICRHGLGERICDANQNTVVPSRKAAKCMLHGSPRCSEKDDIGVSRPRRSKLPAPRSEINHFFCDVTLRLANSKGQPHDQGISRLAIASVT
jgi:hypothetical protein